MSAVGVIEDHAEQEVLRVFADELGYATAHGPDLAHDGVSPERASYADVVLRGRLRAAVARLNPSLPATACDEVVAKVARFESASLVENNRRFHRLLTSGVDVEHAGAEGTVHDIARLVDFDDAGTNDWLAVNQFTVVEDRRERRPDVVVFVNGLPLGVLELKNPADPNATCRKAFNQLETYKSQIPSLMAYNEVLVASNDWEARLGSLTAGWDRYMAWRTVDGDEVLPKGELELPTLLLGVFDKSRLLDLVRSFVVFEDDGERVVKKLAQYHQFHAVRKAVVETVTASAVEGDRRAGVVWHTQGSGKSLSMTFFAGKIALAPEMANPTIVVLTDRNDLDEQLFGTFSACSDLLRQNPVQAESRDHLRDLLKVASGGVVFTTIQKFAPPEGERVHPLLSDRRNIVFIADEAHRSQYDFIDGFARHMRDALPNATFIGFTGTPISSADKDTTAVFGDYIDIYDVQRAVEDQATVPIYYEARLAKIQLDEALKPKLDNEFEEVTEDEEYSRREKLKSKWARLEAMVGARQRLELVARDIVEHFEQRQEVIEGKAMVVCMSRRICVELYEEIIKIRPAWHSTDDAQGSIKVVMTGSASDPESWQQHIRNKPRRKDLAKRVRNAKDPLKIVLVRDMWLTGFDAPALHTMYIDKPIRGHGLMQAIARVNRVFGDKPGGLVVDYLGIADQLKKALTNYTEGDRANTGIDQEDAVVVMQEKLEVVRAMLHGFDYSAIYTLPKGQWTTVAKNALDHVYGLPDGQQRFLKAVTSLSKAFALAVPHEDALAVQDEVGFAQLVRAGVRKLSIDDEKDFEATETAVRQIVSKAIVADEVVDIYTKAGIAKPDISILTDDFLGEVRNMPQRNLALETLKKLINDEIKVRQRTNVVQAKAFSEMLENAVRQYQNRAIEAAEIIEELIALAKRMREAAMRGTQLGLTDDEVAFYDALATNESAVRELTDDTLKQISRELVESIRANVTIDWTIKEQVRAKMRVIIKRLLKKYKYPPDLQPAAVDLVMQQAEVNCADWAA